MLAPECGTYLLENALAVLAIVQHKHSNWNQRKRKRKIETNYNETSEKIEIQSMISSSSVMRTYYALLSNLSRSRALTHTHTQSAGRAKHECNWTQIAYVRRISNRQSRNCCARITINSKRFSFGGENETRYKLHSHIFCSDCGCPCNAKRIALHSRVSYTWMKMKWTQKINKSTHVAALHRNISHSLCAIQDVAIHFICLFEWENWSENPFHFFPKKKRNTRIRIAHFQIA